jgi:SAM-dependent methyltransferase
MELDEYDKMHAVEAEMWWYRGLHANLLTLLGRHGSATRPLLDAGCGTGGLMVHLTHDRPWPAPVFGLDIEPKAVVYARGKSGRPVAVGSVNALPIASNTLDAVVSADVLAHRSVDEVKAAAEAYRCLAPGGVYVVNLPAYRWLQSDHDRRVQQTRRYTEGRLRRLLAQVGFADIRATYWNTILFPLMAIRRLLLPDGGGDVHLYPRPVEAAFRACVLFEARLIGAGLVLPFGGSILALGIKRD